jgi:hypothetical protein
LLKWASTLIGAVVLALLRWCRWAFTAVAAVMLSFAAVAVSVAVTLWAQTRGGTIARAVDTIDPWVISLYGKEWIAEVVVVIKQIGWSRHAIDPGGVDITDAMLSISVDKHGDFIEPELIW